MANEIRLRSNNISGTITDNPLAIGATTINSAGFADLPVVDATNHLLLILDPLEVGGTAEIVRVTAHTAAATSVTVLRGQESSVARSHVFNTTWFHGPVASDFIPSLPADQSAAWVSSFTPVLTQSGTVTFTATYSRYTKIGRTVFFNFVLAITGGAAVAGQQIKVTLPFTAVIAGHVVGQAYIFNASDGLNYTGTSFLETTGTVFFLVNNVNAANVLGASSFAEALAAGDVISGHLVYEATS